MMYLIVFQNPYYFFHICFMRHFSWDFPWSHTFPQSLNLEAKGEALKADLFGWKQEWKQLKGTASAYRANETTSLKNWMKWLKISVVDPDFKKRIRIQLVLADLDPNPMDRAWNFKCFTFLKFENLSSGSKVIGHQSFVLFVKKVKKIIWFHLQK